MIIFFMLKKVNLIRDNELINHVFDGRDQVYEEDHDGVYDCDDRSKMFCWRFSTSFDNEYFDIQSVCTLNNCTMYMYWGYDKAVCHKFVMIMKVFPGSRRDVHLFLHKNG